MSAHSSVPLAAESDGRRSSLVIEGVDENYGDAQPGIEARGNDSTNASESHLVGILSPNISAPMRERSQELKVLDEKILLARNHLLHRPSGHLHRACSLVKIGDLLHTRYRQSGEASDLDETISAYREAVSENPSDGHLELSSCVQNLAIFVAGRYRRNQRDADLDDAILLYKEALALRPLGHPHRACSLSNLLHWLKTRYRRTAQRGDLEDMVVLGRELLVHRPPGHRFRVDSIEQLAASLQKRYSILREVTDLEESVTLYREVLSLQPSNNQHRICSLGNLSCSLELQFKRLGDSKDLDEAILKRRESLTILPVGDPRHPLFLQQLSALLMDRHEYTSNTSDLQEAISVQTEALSICPSGHPRYSHMHTELARSLAERYRLFSKEEDFDQAMLLAEQALSLTPLGTPHHSCSLASLAKLINLKYERSGGIDNLEKVIQLQRKSLVATSASDLSNLASSLCKRYERFQTPDDLEEAVSLQGEALILQPPGHIYRHATLTNLSKSMRHRYNRLGNVNDLEEAIALSREAYALTPPGHVEWLLSATELATLLNERYDRFQEYNDFEEVVELRKNALAVCPPGHHYRALVLGHLSRTLLQKYQQAGDVKELQEVILLRRETLALTAEGHPDRPQCLHGLSNALIERNKKFGELKDLEEAISLSKEAYDASPSGHRHRSCALSHFSRTLHLRYKLSRVLADIEKAILLQKEAVLLYRPGNPGRSEALGELAEALRSRYEHSSRSWLKMFQLEFDRKEIQDCIEKAVTDSLSSSQFRFTLASYWARQVSTDISFRLSMHAHSLLLLQQLLIVHPDLSRQQSRLLAIPNLLELASRAAADAIDAGEVELAAIMLDQGRSVLLGALQRYRSPLHELRTIDSSIANELELLSAQLEQLSVYHNCSENPHSTPLDYAFDMQRRLLTQWEERLTRVRTIAGFSDFLGMPSYEKLQRAATNGPIILLNETRHRCHAIIITFSGPPALIHLPNICPSILRGHYESLRASRSSQRKERAVLLQVLRFLWLQIGCPIVDKLQELGIARGSRIWWCPSSWFNLLPIHAAGLYDGAPDSDMLSLYVSSYTTTISDLLEAQHARRSSQGNRLPQLLIIGESSGDLEHVNEEASKIKKIKGITTKILMGPAATPGSVGNELPQFPWVHFSCHGVVLPNQPIDSYFRLANQNLCVRDIIRMKLQNAEFAFLSACHSAAPGEYLPNENLHLAGALKFAGFRSVVGTMWEMYDSDGPTISSDFYKRMLELGGRHTDAAEALHYAVKRCWKRGIGVERWAMFIHMGA